MLRALAAASLLWPGAGAQSLSLFGPGCCTFADGSSTYNLKTGLTLDECQDFCAREQPRCRSLEHSPWGLGVCLLFEGLPSNVSCLASDKVCWSLAPEHGGPEPMPFGLFAERAAAKELLAGEVWDAMDCARHVQFETFRRQGELAGVVDHEGTWSAVRRTGFAGLSPLGDTEAFFQSKENLPYLRSLAESFSRFLNVVRGDVDIEEVRERRISGKTCFFGYVFMLWYCLQLFRKFGPVEEAQNVSWALRLVFWMQIGGPSSALDLLQSSSWPLHSWDIVAATLDLVNGSEPATSYEAHVAARPVPPAFLPGPLHDFPTRPPRARAGLPCGAAEVAKVATLGFMRQMQMHQLSALQAAWEVVCGAAVGAPSLEVQFVYTTAGPLQEYEAGSMEMRATDWVGASQSWQGMAVRFLPGGMEELLGLESLEDVQANLQEKFRALPSLRGSDVVVCGEPVYVCTAASRILEEDRDERPLLAHLGMALLHQPDVQGKVLDSREKVARFLFQFLAMLARPSVAASAANRITVEQVHWQVGVRLPVAHFAGLHLQPSAQRHSEPKALLFRTKFPTLAHTFASALKLDALRQGSRVELVDMNLYSSLSWAEIAQFWAVVLLPHNVHLIRTGDLYALETVLFVPSEPFIFQFIFPGSNLYAGHGGPPLIRQGLHRRAQRQLHAALSLTGYVLATAPTAAEEGELLPRAAHRHCPYRTPSLGQCSKRHEGELITDVCSFGTSDLDFEAQQPLGCEELLGADAALRPLAAGLCGGNGSEETVLGAAVDPFDWAYGDFNPWCNLEAYRYWYAHTEYALLRGLQRFGSTAELLEGLGRVLLGEGAAAAREAVLREVRKHQRARVRETTQWWAQALLLTAPGGGAPSGEGAV